MIVLCEKHHNDVHSNKLIINGYKETNKGKELDYNFVNINLKNKKYNDEIVNKIKNYLLEKKIIKINEYVVNCIKKEFDIKICKTTLVKMFNDEY